MAEHRYYGETLGWHAIPYSPQMGHIVMIDGQPAQIIRVRDNNVVCTFIRHNGMVHVSADKLVYVGVNEDTRNHTWTCPA